MGDALELIDYGEPLGKALVALTVLGALGTAAMFVAGWLRRTAPAAAWWFTPLAVMLAGELMSLNTLRSAGEGNFMFDEEYRRHAIDLLAASGEATLGLVLAAAGLALVALATGVLAVARPAGDRRGIAG